MHVCFITHEYPKPNFPHGGIGSFVRTISKALVRKGVYVSVVGINTYTNFYEHEVDEGVQIFRLKNRKIKGITWLLNTITLNKFLNALHKKEQIDIIETPELGLAFLNKLPGIKYVIRLHGGHHFFSEAENRGIHKWKGFQEKLSFKKADGFIAVSNYVKEHTRNYLSYHNKPVEIISSPINTERFKPLPSIKKDENLIVFAGTICEKKGADRLIEVMQVVFKEKPESRLELYGADWFFRDGSSYISYLKEEIIPKLEKNSNRIIFKGVVSADELVKKFNSASVCVFPSLMETQGLVAQEAMACESLVIFSELGPGIECIKHKFNGLMCNPKESNSISDNIIWAMNNREEVSIISLEARRSVLKNYEIKTIVQENIAFYNELEH